MGIEPDVHLTAEEVREIADALFYAPWQTAFGAAIGASRQTVAHYLKNGVSGTQAAAIVGLIARRILDDEDDHATEIARLRDEHVRRQDEKRDLYRRFAQRLSV